MTWRWASASVIGTSHIKNGSKLQDAYAISELPNDFIIAVVSDGAGSAEFGAIGARLTCRFLKARFRAWFHENLELPADEELWNWIDELRDQISIKATNRETTTRQFAATLAAIVIAKDISITLHIGDSAIVGRKNGDWDVLCWPENGEYAASTYFVTDDPSPRLRIMRHKRNHDAYAVFTDGICDLALSNIEQAAHPQFFNPMMRPIDTADGKGRLTELSEKLANYLAGSTVCERTDDDKTLILISGG